LTKYEQICTQYDKHYKMHVEVIQERNFLRKKKSPAGMSTRRKGLGGEGCGVE